MQQITEALADIRNVANQIGARGLIDLSDDLRIALATLETAPALYAALKSALFALKSSGYDLSDTAATGTQQRLGDQINAALAAAKEG